MNSMRSRFDENDFDAKYRGITGDDLRQTLMDRLYSLMVSKFEGGKAPTPLNSLLNNARVKNTITPEMFTQMKTLRNNWKHMRANENRNSDLIQAFDRNMKEMIISLEALDSRNPMDFCPDVLAVLVHLQLSNAEKYAEVFRKEGFDSKEKLLLVTSDMLDTMGITAQFDRNAILGLTPSIENEDVTGGGGERNLVQSDEEDDCNEDKGDDTLPVFGHNFDDNEESLSSGIWTCSMCTFDNVASNLICLMCETRHESSSV